jgi:hypothetical protein
LTDGEADLCTEIFGAGLDARRVRILAWPLAWPVRPFVTGPALVVWPWKAALSDFADPAAGLSRQAMFVHEMTHVWQAQNGINLLLGKLRAGDGSSAYAYDLETAPDFSRMNIEQQAMVVEHAFVAARGGVVPHTIEAYVALSSWWRRA